MTAIPRNLNPGWRGHEPDEPIGAPTFQWRRLKKAGQFEEAKHKRDGDGKFTEKVGVDIDVPDANTRAREAAKTPAENARTANAERAYVKTDNPEVALRALIRGKTVELKQPKEVSTLLDKVAAYVLEAKEKDGNVPPLDLCSVSVKGTNIFCVGGKGIPRLQMPQLKGVPEKGSKADKLPKDERGEVDIMDRFVASLAQEGIKTYGRSIPPAELRASQKEINGEKVAGMYEAIKSGVEIKGSIMVSGDNYVVDGHHRYAVELAIDSEDGKLGDRETNVEQVDMSILEILARANAFALEWGIPRAGFGKMPQTSTTTLNEKVEKTRVFREADVVRDTVGRFAEEPDIALTMPLSHEEGLALRNYADGGVDDVMALDDAVSRYRTTKPIEVWHGGQMGGFPWPATLLGMDDVLESGDRERIQREIDARFGSMVGQVVGGLGFESTSRDFGTALTRESERPAYPIIFHVKVPKGTEAADMKEHSDFNENEVLLNRGLTYKITDVHYENMSMRNPAWTDKQGWVQFELEVVPPPRKERSRKPGSGLSIDEALAVQARKDPDKRGVDAATLPEYQYDDPSEFKEQRERIRQDMKDRIILTRWKTLPLEPQTPRQRAAEERLEALGIHAEIQGAWGGDDTDWIYEEVARATEDAVAKFPQLRTGRFPLRTMLTADTLGRQHNEKLKNEMMDWGDGTWAATIIDDYRDTAIVFDADPLNERAFNASADGYGVWAGTNLYGSADATRDAYGRTMHELGHAVMYQEVKPSKKDGKFPEEKFIGVMEQKLMEAGIHAGDIASISDYAARDPYEAWADIFATMNTPAINGVSPALKKKLLHFQDLMNDHFGRRVL